MLSISSLSISKRRFIARIAPLSLLALFSVLLLSPQLALARDYTNQDGDRGQFDLIVKLTGDTSKVAKVTAVREVPNYSGGNYVNSYTLTKDNASTYSQEHFQFINDNTSCRQLPALVAQAPGLGQSSGFYDFKVTAYDKDNKKISPTTDVRFDYKDDCGKDKTVNLAVSTTQVNPDSLGTLAGTITAYESGDEIKLRTVDLRLTGPETKQAEYFPNQGTFRINEIKPGTYTLSGPIRCGSGPTNACTTNADFTTTGPIKAGTNKIDIIYIDGVVNVCGDGCDKAEVLKNGGVLAATTAAEVGTNNDAPGCEGSAGPFGWIVCKVIDGLAAASDTMFSSFIIPLLETRPLDTSADSENYKIWSNFRIFGNIFLIIALLVIVFGQSIGGGLVEAYSAKKVLPRLLVAAILINLSLYLVAFAVDITNVLGRGVGALIQLPFRQSGEEFAIELGATSSVIGFTALVAATSAIWATGIAAFLPWLFFTILVPLFLIFVAILATVIIRNGLLVFLILVSPIAFALYCLPNTEKYFRQWWELLWKTLLIYPIIAIIFAIANVLSVVMSETNPTFGPLLAVIALVIPLFAIPFSFKIAGGIIGKVADGVNGSTAKVNGMMKGRKEQSAFRAKQSRAGRIMSANDRFNSTGIGQRFGTAPVLGRMQGKRTQRLSQINAAMAADYSKTAGAQAIQHDDEAIRAQTYTSYGDAVAGLTERYEKQAIQKGLDSGKSLADATRDAKADPSHKKDAVRAASAANAAGGFGTSQAIFAAEAMGKTGTSFDNQKDQAETIARASRGNESTLNSLAGNLNSVNKSVGRHDLAPSFGTLVAQSKAELPNSTVNDTEKNELYAKGQVNAWNSASLYQHANDKPQNIQAAVAAHEALLSEGIEGQKLAGEAFARATNAQEQAVAMDNLKAAEAKIEQAAVFNNELSVMAPNASGAVKIEIDKATARMQPKLTEVIPYLDRSPSSPSTNKTINAQQEIHQRQENGDYITVIQPNPAAVTVQETAAQRIARTTRSMERFDPNRQ